jgi:hypothetical protein
VTLRAALVLGMLLESDAKMQAQSVLRLGRFQLLVLLLPNNVVVMLLETSATAVRMVVPPSSAVPSAGPCAVSSSW